MLHAQNFDVRARSASRRKACARGARRCCARSALSEGAIRASTSSVLMRSVLSVALLVALAPKAALAAPTDPLPAPLAPYHVVGRARAERAEVLAAHARAHASAQRPAIVGALDDPMIMGAVTNLPISLVGADVSLEVQQTFPLSSILSQRRRSALADVDRMRADTSRVALDVELEALAAYYMLGERRAVARILDEQIVVVGELVTLTRAHYAAGQGIQADVMRLENEVPAPGC